MNSSLYSDDVSSLPTKLRQWTDVVAALYLLLTAAVVCFHRAQFPGWKFYLFVHLVAATGIWMLRRLRLGRLSGVMQFFRDWYPVLLFPVLYKEAERFALAFGDWRLTESIQRLEVAFFGGHPSLYASSLYPWVPLSEYLHFCYFAYLLLLPVVGGLWYFNGRATGLPRAFASGEHDTLQQLFFLHVLSGGQSFLPLQAAGSAFSGWILLSARPFFLGARWRAGRRFPECARFGLSRHLAGGVAATAALGLGTGPRDSRVGGCDCLWKVSLRVGRAGRTSCGRRRHGMLPPVPSERSCLTLWSLLNRLRTGQDRILPSSAPPD